MLIKVDSSIFLFNDGHQPRQTASSVTLQCPSPEYRWNLTLFIQNDSIKDPVTSEVNNIALNIN